jgi:hypothetical protein
MKNLTITLAALLISANAFALDCNIYKPGASGHVSVSGKNIFQKLSGDQELEIIDADDYVYLTINRPPTQAEAEQDQASGDTAKPRSLANFGVNRTGKTQRVDANLLGYVIQCSK